MLRTCFNESWQVTDPTRFPSYATPAVRDVRLPHDAMIASPRDADTGYTFQYGAFRGEDKVYKKTFTAPDNWADKSVLLEFEGVYANSTVYLNGNVVARQPYGYTRFLADLSPYIRAGENEIRVLARGGMAPNSRWYPGTGIYRDVWLLVSEKTRVAPYGLKIKTNDADASAASITVTVDIENGSATAKTLTVRETAYAPDGSFAASAVVPFTVQAGDTAHIRQNLCVSEPSLWSPETPSLYRVKAELLENGSEIDRAEERFGIRVFTVDALRGLRVNGKSYKLRGGCIHHDNGPIGSAEFATAAHRRVRYMKAAGYNAIRSSHNPMSRALLEACDELGVFVMDETFDTWNQPKTERDYNLFFADWWMRDTKAMVDKDYNHPCVLFYSIGNEIAERDGSCDGGAWVRRQAEYIRSLDDSRPIASALCGIADPEAPARERKSNSGEKGFMGVPRNSFSGPRADYYARKSDDYASGLDVVGMNYLQGFYADQVTRYPNRVLCGTESMIAQYADVWTQVMAHESILGDFCWTAWEYLGEAGCGKIDYPSDGYERSLRAFMGDFPWIMAYCGDFDLTGLRRTQSYYREIVWGLRKKPYIAVQRLNRHGEQALYTPWSWSDTVESWTWPGYEGKETDVEAYSDADEIELFVNGESFGKKAVVEYHALFTVAYRPGRIEAVAYRAGEETGRFALETAGAPVALALTAETLGTNGELHSGGRDLAYVRVDLLDACGKKVFENPEITVSVEGAASLLGLGSADPVTDRNFYDSETRLFDGTAIAILRTADMPGTIRVTASAPGYAPVTLELESK